VSAPAPPRGGGGGGGGGSPQMPHSVVSDRQRGQAKQLRQTMTRAETLLWRHLKAGRLDGLGFRRQTPIRNYIADFVCFSAKVIVELDGESHDFAERQESDGRRDAFFESEGFRVLRFTNNQVMSNLEGVVEAIRQAINAGSLGLPPSPTLPHKGGGSIERCALASKNVSDNRGSQP
jgi:very-short-patch-repair endonuclease